MSKKNVLLVFSALIVLAVLLFQIPGINARASWGWERLTAYVNGVVHPAGPVPTARPVTPELIEAEATIITVTPQPTPTGQPTLTPTATLEPLPAQVSLAPPPYELQDMNNCGPATLSMALHVYNWNGDQFDVSNVIKPERDDRNVNPDEMVYWVRNYAGWLRAEYRVNGNITLLKRLLAAGFPVIIEETFTFEDPYWPNDDLWAAHYLLVTGYDDATRTFTGQDSFHGANQVVSYEDLGKGWKPFNYVYMLVYLPEEEGELRTILGPDWDPDVNRQNALTASQSEAASHPNDAYAWFNYGANLVYFESYEEAARAFDQARNIGLPQRMMRYQFSPFLAYFHSHRTEDLLTLTRYALDRTPNSEEAWLWHGWALYRQGDTNGARANWEKALSHRPGYPDAQYALDFVR